MGIHGEPGAEKQVISQLDSRNLTRDLVSIICRRLDHAMHMKTDLAPHCSSLAVLVNNLGAVSQSEMLIVSQAVSNFLYNEKAGIFNGNVHRVHLFVGSFMTSLQMTGVSVSCFMLPSDNGIMEQLLHARTECTAWSKGFKLLPPSQRSVVPRVVDTTRSTYTRNALAANVYSDGGQTQVSEPMGGGAHMGATLSKPTPVTQPRPVQQRGRATQSTPAHQLGDGTMGVYTGAKPRSGAAGTVTGLSPQTEMNILKITSALQSHSDELTVLDRKTGDGDLGDTGMPLDRLLPLLPPRGTF